MGGLAAHRIALGVLEHDRRGFAAVDTEIEHGAGAGQRVAQLAGVDLDPDRLGPAAVDDPGHPPGCGAAGGRPASRRRCGW